MFKSVMSAAFAICLTSCTSILAPVLTPDVETAATSVKAGNYQLDPAHASLVFKIDHLGFSTYVGRFETLDATLDFDAAAPEAASLVASADVSSLDIANEDFAAELIGPKWLNAAEHPQISFASSGIEITGEATGTVTGNLTLHGVTKPVILNVTFNGGAQDRLRGAYITGFSATGQINRTDFGIDRFSGILTDTIDIEIETEFIHQD